MPPIDLLLSNWQAPGDAAALTALVRDIHACYPGKFRTRIHSPYTSSVWLHNPHAIAGQYAPPPPASRFIKCHYGEQMRRSHHEPMHFTQGFIDYFNGVVGKQYDVNVTLTQPRPDLYISPEEAAKPPLGLDKPYWVMMAGGKSDITTKWWDKRKYQAVVDRLQGHVNIVQAGGKEHYHPILQNTYANVVGTTSLRDLITLIYHAQGVICPITFAMHVAGAFDKPCVVIAGGRETPAWEAYPNHRFLHTVGKIHCATSKACWRGTTQKGEFQCHDVVRAGTEGNLISVARCMHLITPDMVVAAVKSYNAGGTGRKLSLPVLDIPPVDIPFYGTPEEKEVAPPAPSKPIITGTMGDGNCPRPLGEKFTIVAVLYGGAPGNETYTQTHPNAKDQGEVKHFHDLHNRFLDGILTTSPVCGGRVELRVAINGVSDGVANRLVELNSILPVKIYGPNENRLKYPRLREIFHDTKDPIKTEWVVYFDDDVIFKPDWLEALERGMDAGLKEGARCFGEHYSIRLTPGVLRWHQSRYWWRNRKMTGGLLPRVDFITGGAWAMRAEDLRELNWPDPGLTHTGGDVALGSAMHQLGWKIWHVGSFVDEHNTSRRGADPKPPTLAPLGTVHELAR
jgi:ADP-heptose:LPS heptosyltransferase